MATDTQVLVVGAGPAGLFMAAELNRHGTRLAGREIAALQELDPPDDCSEVRK